MITLLHPLTQFLVGMSLALGCDALLTGMQAFLRDARERNDAR